MAIKRLDENCPWCNKKTVGQDESGFRSCTKCDYDTNRDRHMSLNESTDRSMKIYDELVCCESNPTLNFTSLCSKFKGHKGKHVDSEWREFPW